MLLQNIQDEFAELINADDDKGELVVPSENISIYRNTMISSLTQTLSETYKMIVKLVGEDFFRKLAREYIDRYPSLSGNLHDYGEYFSDFLQETPEVENFSYLEEVAKFEWACHLLHFAGEASELDIKLLESFSPEQFQELKFVMHPASRVMQFDYPILRILDLCKGEIDEEINLNEGGMNLLLIRRELEVNLVPLSAGEFIFLSALTCNETLAVALDETLECDPDFRLDDCLPKWISDKTIVEVSR